jgi:hypothetical protein
VATRLCSAAVLILCAACVTTQRAAYTAPALAGPPRVAGEAAARVLVLVATDADPRLAPMWLDHAARAADAVDAALRAAGFRTTREPLARWSARVTVICPIRGPEFSVVVEARREVVDRLDVNGRDWGAAELAELGKAVRQRVESSEAIAALAGVPPRRPEPSAAAEPGRAQGGGAPAGPPRRRLVVLDFRGSAGAAALAVLADQARAAAAEAARTSGTEVMTRERVLAALKERGRPAEPCADGGACEVETARAAGADLVVTGEVSDVGGARFLVLKLVDAASGALLASKHAQAKDDLALVEAAKPAAAALFQ